MEAVMEKGYLVLQDGRVFEGIRFGAPADTVGELVFTTGMCGYIETLTDPSYAGQIVMQTYPLIGNYGIIREDFEGACCVKGYVVREWCDAPSNFRTDCDLDTYLKEQGYTLPAYYDTQLSAATAYGVNAIPCTYFIDAQGRAVARSSGAIDAQTLRKGIEMIQ